jgi:hypothetical protein
VPSVCPGWLYCGTHPGKVNQLEMICSQRAAKINFSDYRVVVFPWISKFSIVKQTGYRRPMHIPPENERDGIEIAKEKRSLLV